MQRPNEQKRAKIIQIAGQLFATRPFHEVRLDDVAAAAAVGKGTLYIYFKSKEDLYVSVVHEGFARLVEQLRQQTTDQTSPQEALENIVRRLVGLAFEHPGFFELMRNLVQLKEHPQLDDLRKALIDLIIHTLRRGVRQGLWNDPHPELTAVFIPGLVRSAMLYGPANLSEDVLASQILRLLHHGIAKREGR